MSRVAIFFFCFFLALTTAADLQNYGKAVGGAVKEMRSFTTFKATFAKEYESPDEERKRFGIFRQSLKRIAQQNAKDGAVYGVNQFADLTPEEFRNTVLMTSPITPPTDEDREAVGFVDIEPVGDTPAQLDWRNKGAVTPVKNQGQCGSCWAFSTVENIESMWILAGKANATTLRLSEQQVVDCDNSDNGCGGGNPPTAYNYVKNAGGLETEADYPYKAVDGTCAFKKQDVVADIKSWKYATKEHDEKTLQATLISTGPLSICVDAANWQHYQSGVMTAWECAWVNILDHCVQLVGYDTTKKTESKDYWIVRNSWSTSWGIKGYIHLEMWDNTCGLTNEATTSIV